MKSQSNLETQFMPMLLEMDLIHEWARLVKAKAHASIFVSFFIELMRDGTNDQSRISSMAFLTFLRGRAWPDVLGLFERHADPEDLEALKDPFAEEFFAIFSMCALQTVQDYYEQFLEQRKNAPKQKTTPDELPPVTRAPGAERAAFVDEIVGEVILEIKNLIEEPGIVNNPFIQEVIREIRKLMDEGDGWKRGADSE